MLHHNAAATKEDTKEEEGEEEEIHIEKRKSLTVECALTNGDTKKQKEGKREEKKESLGRGKAMYCEQDTLLKKVQLFFLFFCYPAHKRE